MTQNRRYPALTVEKLAVDCLDVRELQRAPIFNDHWVELSMVSLRWPGIEKMRAYRYLIQLKFRNQVVLQQIRVSWTRCYYGSARPWLHFTFCEQRVARLFKGPFQDSLGLVFVLWDSPENAKRIRRPIDALCSRAC